MMKFRLQPRFEKCFPGPKVMSLNIFFLSSQQSKAQRHLTLVFGLRSWRPQAFLKSSNQLKIVLLPLIPRDFLTHFKRIAVKRDCMLRKMSKLRDCGCKTKLNTLDFHVICSCDGFRQHFERTTAPPKSQIR